MLAIQCDKCLAISGEPMMCCNFGCGYFIHIKCMTIVCSKFICQECTVKHPTGNSSMVLKRVADLTNIVLQQSLVMEEMRLRLATLDSTMSTTKEKIEALGNDKAKSSTVDDRGRSRGLFRTRTTDHLTVPRGETRSRSPSKRRRADDDSRKPRIGSNAASNHCVPSVQRIEKRQVFVSRISPEVSARRCSRRSNQKSTGHSWSRDSSRNIQHTHHSSCRLIRKMNRHYSTRHSGRQARSSRISGAD